MLLLAKILCHGDSVFKPDHTQSYSLFRQVHFDVWGWKVLNSMFLSTFTNEILLGKVKEVLID